MTKRAIIVGAGAGGLSAAVDLATAGWKVEVFETNTEPGGKMHQQEVGDVGIDGGPTVFTMHSQCTKKKTRKSLQCIACDMRSEKLAARSRSFCMVSVSFSTVLDVFGCVQKCLVCFRCIRMQLDALGWFGCV